MPTTKAKMIYRTAKQAKHAAKQMRRSKYSKLIKFTQRGNKVHARFKKSVFKLRK